MLILAKLIGIIIVAKGIILTLSPKTTRQLIAFWEKGKRLYIAGVLRLLVGVILLLAASQCRLISVVVVFGILILMGGMIFFILGLARIKSMLDWWNTRSPLALRLMGLITIAIGALLVYSV